MPVHKTYHLSLKVLFCNKRENKIEAAGLANPRSLGKWMLKWSCAVHLAISTAGMLKNPLGSFLRDLGNHREICRSKGTHMLEYLIRHEQSSISKSFTCNQPRKTHTNTAYPALFSGPSFPNNTFADNRSRLFFAGQTSYLSSNQQHENTEGNLKQ